MALSRNDQSQVSHERQQALERSTEVNIRFFLEPGITPMQFIREIGMNIEDVVCAVELQNDGWGRLLADEDTRQWFVG